MRKTKKYTCMDFAGNKVEGAIEGTKKQVLAWMKETFPGLHHPTPKENEAMMVGAFFFFFEGEITEYLTADGEEVYLAEVGKE